MEWLADSTRCMRKPRSYSSLEEAIARTAATYRRGLWDNQNAYVEVWLEKEALAGVLYRVTEVYDVPLMVVKGFPSKDFDTVQPWLSRKSTSLHIYITSAIGTLAGC